MKFLKLTLLLTTQSVLGTPSPSPITQALINCLDTSKVPQAYPGTSQFNLSSQPHNIRFPFHPKAIALPKTVPHVQAAVACGRKFGVKVNAKSGGHNYASHGLGGEDGHLVLDMQGFDGVSVDKKTGVATVGTGARLGNMAIALDRQGKRALPHGVCPKVGVGGHVLHGGWGYSTHNHGLFLDHLVEVELVLADSSVVTASSTKHPELFWALRGAGMSFGIATNFKFRTIAQPKEIQLFYLPFVWNKTQAITGWKIWQDYASSKLRPKEMNIRVVVSDAKFFGLEGMIFLFEGGYHGTAEDYLREIDAFLKALKELGGFLPGSSTGIPELTGVSYLDSLLYVNNNALLGMGGDEPLESTPDQMLHINGAIKSMFTNALTNPSIEHLMEQLAGYEYSNAWLLIVAAIGGPNSVMSKIPSSSTSFAYRDRLLLWELADTEITPNATYIPNPWLNNLVANITKLEKGKVGSYYNYADPTLGNHTQAGVQYWGKNGYERLSALKGLYDPRGTFENPQTVRGRGKGYN